MTGVTPTPPAGPAAAMTGVAALALRRPPEDAERALSEPETPRRAAARHPGMSPAPDPDGHRGRLVDVFA